MKWVEYLKDDEDRKLGEVATVEDGEFAILSRMKVVKETAEPKNVADQATKITASLQKFVEASVADQLDAAIKTLTVKTASKRPGAGRIETYDNEMDDPTCGFKSSGQFHKAVRLACMKVALPENLQKSLTISQKAAGASEDINADGGYATPVAYATTVFDDIMKQDSLMGECFLIPMESNSIKLPAINYLTQGSYGVTAYWEGEAQTLPVSKPAFRQPQLNLSKLTVLVPVTTELLEDGLAVEAIVDKLSAEAMKFQINQTILRGTGAGQPTGIINHASTPSVTRTTTGKIVANDVLTMRARLISNKGAKWLINKDCEPGLLQIQDAGGRFLYFAPGSFAENHELGRLLGFDVVPMYNLPSYGTVGDILCVNLKEEYALGYKSIGVQKAMSIHLYFNTDQVAYRWTFRMDGRPWRDTTLAAANGTATYGSAVQLAT